MTNMPAPSSAPEAHCAPCGMSELASDEPKDRREHQLENYLVDRFVDDLSSGRPIAKVDLSITKLPVLVQRRHVAAQRCATTIFSGDCPMFTVVRHFREGNVIVPTGNSFPDPSTPE